MIKSLSFCWTIFCMTILIEKISTSETNLTKYFSSAVKTAQDQKIIDELNDRLPKFLDLNLPSKENVDKVFTKFTESVRLIPSTIRADRSLDSSSAHEIFPALQPIYRYIKDSTWKSIIQLLDLPTEILQIPVHNLPEGSLKKLLSFSNETTASKVLDLNSNRIDFSDEQKSILVENYIEKIKSKINPGTFQELITQKLGASFLRYIPLDYLVKDPIFNDNNVIRNVATWLHLLRPIQRDAITNKAYRLFTDTTGRIGDGPLRLSSNDPSTFDTIARMMPSLSPRQIINTIGENIVPLLERSSIQQDQSCPISLALLNRTLDAKRRTNRYFRPDPKLIHRWQECYSGCDLRDLLNSPSDLKELLKNHPNPENCEDLVDEVKKEYGLERGITAAKLRDVSDIIGSLYRSDELNNLSDELMAELGRDEKILEKIGSQDLSLNEARAILNKIPRSTQNLWGKNMLAKLGHLIPGLDNTILQQILTHGRGDLPSLSNFSSTSFIRKLVPSKIRLLIDQYATEPNLAKYRQLLASDYAKRYIKSETLMKLLEMRPDTLRLIRFTPAQASTGIAKNLLSERNFDGTLSSLNKIQNFINGLTKSDVDKIKPEESLLAVQQVFGGARNKNIDNQMHSNTRFAFGNLLRRGLQTSEANQNVDEYVKGLFREDNLVDDLNPQLFTTMSNAELEAINRLNSDQAERFWNALGAIREPVCCSLVKENRYRLADFALKYYGSATGDIDNVKLTQLGPFLVTSLRASDLRRITTDALMNKIQFFKSLCFQPDKAEAQALGAKLNTALSEVDEDLKVLHLDLIGELVAFLPADITASGRVLARKTNFLSKSMDKLLTRDEKCQISNADGFLTNSIQSVKRSLAKAFIERQSSLFHSRERRQISRVETNLTCREIRRLASAISALTLDQISTIDNNEIFDCIGVFGSIIDFPKDKLNKVAEKFVSALEARSRHVQSLTQAELYELNTILTGFTPGQLTELRDRHFRDGNFLSFVGNLQGWNMEQLRSLVQLALGKDQRVNPSFFENAGQILCAVNEQDLRRIPADDIKSYLTILANIECPTENNGNYSSIMFDIVKNIYRGDLFRPSILGSLGNIASGLQSIDLNSLSPDLINFIPQQAFSRLSPTVLKSFTNDQLKNLNIEQIQTIPNSLFNSLGKQQIAILNQILNPFKTSVQIEDLSDISEKSHSDTEWTDSGVPSGPTMSIFVICLIQLISMLLKQEWN